MDDPSERLLRLKAVLVSLAMNWKAVSLNFVLGLITCSFNGYLPHTGTTLPWHYKEPLGSNMKSLTHSIMLTCGSEAAVSCCHKEVSLVDNNLRAQQSAPAGMDCYLTMHTLAQVWGNAATLSRLPVAHLAYQTAALETALEQLQKPGLDACPGLTPALLQGVSNHLSSPSTPVR